MTRTRLQKTSDKLSHFKALRSDPLVQMYANAPEDIHQLAKNTNPMLRKAIEWAKAIVISHEV